MNLLLLIVAIVSMFIGIIVSSDSIIMLSLLIQLIRLYIKTCKMK
jgi:hypothetical protein